MQSPLGVQDTYMQAMQEGSREDLLVATEIMSIIIMIKIEYTFVWSILCVCCVCVVCVLGVCCVCVLCVCVCLRMCMCVCHLERRVHEVELQQILHSQRFQQQHNIWQIGTLYLWHCGNQHLTSICCLSIEPKTLPTKIQQQQSFWQKPMTTLIIPYTITWRQINCKIISCT